MGMEFRLKGINLLLGPTIGPIGRVVTGGRNWESFSTDPYLTGQFAYETVKGIQAVGVITSTKHFLANEVRGWLGRCLQFNKSFLLTSHSKKQTGKTPRPLGESPALKAYHQTLTTKHCMSFIYGPFKTPYMQALAALCAHIIVSIIHTHVKTANL
jgi:hypothetical protein